MIIYLIENIQGHNEKDSNGLLFVITFVNESLWLLEEVDMRV